MARPPVYKGEVADARRRLLANGVHPSVAALRKEIGYGSNTTIHRLLKEIETDEELGGERITTDALIAALQDPLRALATRLREEADEVIAEHESKFDAERAQWKEKVHAAEEVARSLRAQLNQLELTAGAHAALVEQQKVALNQLETDKHALQTQVTGLEERARAEAHHRRSLEEQVTHARTSLEQYQKVVKEQRDQLQRQYDQQITFIQGENNKLSDAVTALREELRVSHADTTRLNAELARAHIDLDQAHSELRALQQVKEHHAMAMRKLETLEQELKDANTEKNNTQEQLAITQERVTQLTSALQERVLEGVTVLAQLKAQQELVSVLKSQLIDRKPSTTAKKPSAPPD